MTRTENHVEPVFGTCSSDRNLGDTMASVTRRNWTATLLLMSKFPLLLLLATSFVLVFLLAPAFASSPPKPAIKAEARLRAAVLAARSQRSLHYVSTTRGKTGQGLWTDFVATAEPSAGEQWITVHKNGRVGHVTVIANKQAAYFQGDAFGITNYMSIPRGSAAKYAGRWIEIPHGTRAYVEVSAGVMLGSAVDALKPLPPLTITSPAAIAGQSAIGIQGQLVTNRPWRIVLYVRATAEPLPIEEIQSGGPVHYVITMVWNYIAKIAVPTTSVLLSVVLKQR